MPETPTDTPEVQNQGQDPYAVLASVQGPTKTQVEAWKAATCNGRMKIFSPDLKRVFLLRGLSSREWEASQNEIPVNTPPEKLEQAVQSAIIIKACNWCSLTKGSLSEEVLRAAGAGLAPALYEFVCQLSDFIAPSMLERVSADL